MYDLIRLWDIFAAVGLTTFKQDRDIPLLYRQIAQASTPWTALKIKLGRDYPPWRCQTKPQCYDFVSIYRQLYPHLGDNRKQKNCCSQSTMARCKFHMQHQGTTYFDAYQAISLKTNHWRMFPDITDGNYLHRFSSKRGVDVYIIVM